MKRLLSLLCASALLVAACAERNDRHSASPTAAPVNARAYAAPGPHGVGVTTLALVDTTRPTPPNGDYAGSIERRMQVEIWYPASSSVAAPEARDVPLEGGPYPLIIFAHGLSSVRRQSASYTRHLASHGYVVVSPDFPASNLASPGGPRVGAVSEQPRDVSFIIDEMQRLSAESGNRFAGALNGDVGMTGHSAGGLTALLVAYGPARDERVKALLPISSPGCFIDSEIVGGVSVPLMVLGGSEDLIVGPVSIRDAYDAARPPRYFVELQGADHMHFADSEDDDAAIADWLRRGPLSDEALPGDTRSVPEIIESAVADAVGGGEVGCATRDGRARSERISGERQRELLRLFGTIFFAAYLRGDEAAIETLRGGTLRDIAPEAVIEFE